MVDINMPIGEKRETLLMKAIINKDVFYAERLLKDKAVDVDRFSATEFHSALVKAIITKEMHCTHDGLSLIHI